MGKAGAGTRKWWLHWIALVVAGIMVFPSLVPQAMADGSGSYPAPETGDWTVNNLTVVTGETIILTGNLTVGSGGDLTLETCELRMNLTGEGSFKIRVNAGGVLRILNSTVTNNTPYHYKFEVYGNLVVYQSTIEELWGQVSTPIGGIQVYSSAVTISYSTISKSMTSAVYADGHYPVISYSTLNDSVYGLYLKDVAEPSIRNTTEFYDHVTIKNVTIPTGGGNISTAYLGIPDQAIIMNASLNITGEYGQQEFSVFHTDFGAGEIASSANVTIAGGDVTLHEGPYSYFNETTGSDFNDGTHSQTQTTTRSNGEVQLGFSGSVGANKAPAYGTATASSSDPGLIPSNAIDDNTITKWRSSSGTSPQWLRVDMGNGYNNGRMIKKVEFLATDIPNRPKDFTIQTAPYDNPNQWTTRTTVTGNTQSTWSATYPTPFWARYVKISITNTQNGMPVNRPTIQEFRVYLASYYSSGNYASGAFDAGSVVDWKTTAPTVSIPESAGATYELKTKTSMDSTTWTGWSAVDAQTHAISSPRGRYLKYALNLTASTDSIGSDVLSAISIAYKPISLHQWEQSSEQDFGNGTMYGLETVPGGGLRLSSWDCQMIYENEFDYPGAWIPGELDVFSNAESSWNATNGNAGPGSWDQRIVINNGNGEYGIDQWIDQNFYTGGFLTPSNVTLKFSRKFTTTSNGIAGIVPKAQLIKPDNSTVTVWEGSERTNNETVYTNLTVNITSYMNQSGTYTLRLFTTMSASLSQQSVTIHNYWDDVYLNYTSLPPCGSFYSQILDAEVTAQWDSIFADCTVPANTNVSLQTRTSNDNETWSNWSGSASNPTDFEIESPNGRYFQTMVLLQTSQWNITPTVNGVCVNYSIYETTGYIISVATTTTTDITYARMTVNATLFNQSVYLYLSNDNGAIWNEIIPDYNHYFEVEDNILKYKVVLRTGDNSQTPILHDVTVYYSRYHYATDVSIDVGASGNPQWNTTGEFSTTVRLNNTNTNPPLTQALQDYIDLYSAADNLSIPLKIYSSTGGKVRCSNLSISYYMPYLNNNNFRNNNYGAYLLNCPDLKFIGCSFEDLSNGLVCTNSVITITDSSFWNATTRSLWLSSDSEILATGTVFDRSTVLAQDTSVLEARRYLDLTVFNEDGNPASGRPVQVKNAYATTVFQGTTDISGMILRQVLTEFVMTGSSVSYHTPHTAQIGSSNASIVMDANRVLTVYGEGDADNDSITDWEEGWNNIDGFDAGNHIYQREQVETGYSSGGVRVSHKNGAQTIMNESVFSVEEGTYRIFVIADGNDTGAKLEIRVNNSNGNVLVGPDTHPVRELPDWYRTPEFSLQNPTTIRISLKDISPDSPSQRHVFVQRVMVVRVKDEFGNPQFPGDLISDALVADTDQDLLEDGCETKGEDYWFEAEDHKFGNSFVLSEWNASNSYALSRRQSTSEMVDSETFGINPSGGTYQLAVRGRANESVGSQAVIRVRLNYFGQTLADNNYTLFVNYTWNISTEFKILRVEGQNIQIIINDMDAQSRYSAYIDRILLTQTREETNDPYGQSWFYNTNGKFEVSCPEYNKGMLFMATGQNPTTSTLFGLIASTGTPVWMTQLDLNRIVKGSVAVDNDTVYIGVNNSLNSPPAPAGFIQAYYQTNGTLKWSLDITSPVTGTPSIAGDQLFVLDNGGTLHVINISNGQELRSMAAGSGIVTGAAPVIDDTTVYVVVKNGANSVIKAYDRYSTIMFWTSGTLNSSVSGTPALIGGLYIVGQDNGFLNAYSARNGTRSWFYLFAGSVTAMYSAVSDGTVIAATGTGLLRAIWKDNGTLRWQTSIGAGFSSSPAIYGGEIYITADNGYLYVQRLDNGSLVWSRMMGNVLRSSPVLVDIDGDGFIEILVGSNDFNLYALNGGRRCYREQAIWPGFCNGGERRGSLAGMEPVFPTPTISADTDMDILADGFETGWYFGYDRIEAEDYFDACNQIDHQSTVSLNGSNVSQIVKVPWERLSMPINKAGHYRITLSGTVVVRIEGAGIDEEFATALDDQFQFSLRAANITINRNDTSLNQNPIYENRSWHYISTERVEAYPQVSRFWFYIGEFDFSAGNFTVQIKVNDTSFYMMFANSSRVTMLNITMDYLRVESTGADPLNRDCDNDSVIDGEEINNGACLWNPDADEDGLSDAQEIMYGTNPECRDIDLDGLRDRIELGLSGETDPYTIWDTTPSRASRFELEGRNLTSPPLLVGTMSNNDTDAGVMKTNATNRDTDGDGLPDGCIDGWSYDSITDEWGNFNETTDNLHNFWEGEDVDLDGAIDTGNWNDGTGPGETNGTKWDNDGDGMPDGWESWYRLNPLSTAGEDGAGGNPDNMAFYNAPWDYQLKQQGQTNDTLWNYDEYIVCTNPRSNNTDLDNATDAQEAVIVIMRTNVTNGAWKFMAYENANLTNTTITFKEKQYKYSEERNWSENLTNGSIWGGMALNPFIKFFDEQSFIMINNTANEIQVAKMTPVGHIVEFNSYIFDYLGLTSYNYNRTSRHQEVYLTEPTSANSDGTLLGGRVDLGNGIADGNESDWNIDSDGDGLVNARDIDSDNDWVQDTEEGGCGEYKTDLDGDGKPNMNDTDSDGDSISETVEWPLRGTMIPQYDPGSDVSESNLYCNPPYDPDCDDDGLLDGYNITVSSGDYRIAYFNSSQHAIANISNGGGSYTFIGELSLGTNWSDKDTDHDKLIDGNNRTISGRGTYYGEVSVGTNATLTDTDMDTVTDGNEVYGWTYYYEDLDGNKIAAHGHSDPRAGHVDSDNDGLNDSVDYLVSDGLNNDSDFDGLADGLEKSNVTNYLDQDTDNDYLPDGAMDLNLDGDKMDIGEYEDKNCNEIFCETGETSPLMVDTDHDNVSDGLECRVVRFRTNAVNASGGLRTSGAPDPFLYNQSKVWLEVDIGTDHMELFGYWNDVGSKPADAVRLVFNTSDGFPIYYSAAYQAVLVYYGTYHNFTKGYNYLCAVDEVTAVTHSTKAFWSREVGAQLSNPLINNTDSDGLDDGQEILNMSRFETNYISLMDVDKDGLFNAYDNDSDGDGIVDSQDLMKNESGTMIPYWWVDVDGDGLPCALDTDSNNDTILDNVNPPDPLGNPSTTDSDHDGISDIFDGPHGNWTGDFDHDGYPNYLDPDSDGDGLADGNNVTWTLGDPEYDSWKDVFHISHVQNDSIHTRTFYGEGWHVTSPWLNDTDYDGLWDGYNPVQTINYSGFMRIGKTRFYVMNGRAYGDYRYFNISGLGLKTYGELTYGTDPLKADTDNDSFTDGDEVCGFFQDDTLLPRDDYVSGSPWSAQYPLFTIDTGSWVKIPFYVDNQISYLDFLLSLTTIIADNGNQANITVKVTNKTNESIVYANYSKRFYATGNPEVYHYPYLFYEEKLATHEEVYCCVHNIPLGILPLGSYLINISVGAGTGQSRLAIVGKMILATRGFYGANPASEDSDNDGLNDSAEVELGTSVKRDDTDRDGWYDSEDYVSDERDVDGDLLTYPREMYFETDPLNPDCDNDLLNDYQEVIVWGSDPWNAQSDSDTLMDGYEVLGWDVYTITSRSAIIGIEKKAQKNESFSEYITVEHFISNPTKCITDSYGMGDMWEFTCSTCPGSTDTDHDNIPDELDFEKDIIETEPPRVHYDWVKPAGSFEVHGWVNVSDPSGIDYTEFYVDDALNFAFMEVGQKEVHHEFQFKLSVSQTLKMPSLVTITEDSFGNCGTFFKKMGMGAFDQAENIVGKNAGRLMGPLHGGITAGFVTAFLDTVASTVDLISKLGSGKNLEGIAKISDSFTKNGLGPFQQMIDAVYSQEEEQNPFDPQTESFSYETYKWSWAAGYVFGMIVTAYAGAKGTGELFSATGGALSSVAVGDGIAAASGELVTAADISAKLAEWGAKFAGLSKGAKALIYISIVAGATATLKLVFPELFSSWLSAGFGAVMCTQVITDKINTGISTSIINKIKMSFNKYVLAKIDNLYVWLKYKKFGSWTNEVYEAYINNLENYGNLGRIRPKDIALCFDDSLNKDIKDKFVWFSKSKSTNVIVGNIKIENSAILRWGDEGHGWDHIWRKHVTGQIPNGDLFPDHYGVYDEAGVKSLIDDTLLNCNTPTDLNDGWLEFTYNHPNYPGRPPIKVVTNNGEIWTAYPGTKG